MVAGSCGQRPASVVDILVACGVHVHVGPNYLSGLFWDICATVSLESIMTDIIKELEKEQLRDEVPEFAAGDTVRVLYLVREGAKERIQAFEGVCIGRRGGGVDETFTVRKISSGIGVERIFPLHTPTVSGIEVVRRGRVRRAKLHYLRGRRGKSARIAEKRTVR